MGRGWVSLKASDVMNFVTVCSQASGEKEESDVTEKRKEELSRRQFFGTAGKGVAAGVGAAAAVAAGGAQAAETPQREGGYRVLLLGQLYDVRVEDEGAHRMGAARKERQPSGDEDVIIKSPIPGLIFDVPVKEGQEVGQGDILVIVEAMKMEMAVAFPLQGSPLSQRSY